jgi:hypothetical protein
MKKKKRERNILEATIVKENGKNETKEEIEKTPSL